MSESVSVYFFMFNKFIKFIKLYIYIIYIYVTVSVWQSMFMHRCVFMYKLRQGALLQSSQCVHTVTLDWTSPFLADCPKDLLTSLQLGQTKHSCWSCARHKVECTLKLLNRHRQTQTRTATQTKFKESDQTRQCQQQIGKQNKNKQTH